MGVVQVFAGLEGAGLYLEAHLAVGIAEGHALGSQPVHLFHTEDGVVARVVEQVLVYLHAVYDVGRHLQAFGQFVEGGQEHFLDDLQVAEIARGQVVHDERHLLGQRLQLVRLGPDELEDVGILLVGHDAAARGALLGQPHETEVLRVEEAGVVGQFGQGARHGGHGEGYVALGLAASHLRIHHIVVHRVEAQQACGHLPVEGEGAAVAGGRAQRVAVGHPVGGLHEEQVVGERLGIGAEP